MPITIDFRGSESNFSVTTRVSQLGGTPVVHSVMDMNALQNTAFQHLLSAWRRREEARSAGTFADLGAARKSLDAARSNMHSALQSSLR